MNGMIKTTVCFKVLPLVLFLALHTGLLGCMNGSVEVFPETGSVEQGPFDAQVVWTPELNSETLKVSLNNEDVTPLFEKDEGFASVRMDLTPGRKMISAQLMDSIRIPYIASSIFTATSDLPRESFQGGLLSFSCESGFLNSPVQIPGIDLDMGFLENLGSLLGVTGVFPSGDSDFPSTPVFPLIFGLIPKQVTHSVHEEIPNAIALSPVDMTLPYPFDPEDPEQEGNICEFSFLLEGTILPAAENPEPGDVKAVMIQDLKEVTISTVTEGECTPLFTLPPEIVLITFNYTAS